MVIGLKIFHLLAVLILLISVCIILITSLFKVFKFTFPKFLNKIYLFAWAFIFISSYYFILSSIALIGKSYRVKILFEREGKVKEKIFKIDYENPLWIIRKGAKEYYYGDTLNVDIKFPYEKEVIACFSMDKKEYDPDLLRAVGIYKIEFLDKTNRWIMLSFILFAFPIFVFFSTFRGKLNQNIFDDILKILLTFYIIAMSYFCVLFGFSILNIIFISVSLLFYFISKRFSKVIKEFLEYKIMFSFDFNSLFWKISISLIFLLFISLIFNKIDLVILEKIYILKRPYQLIKRLYQPVYISFLVLISSVYWHTHIEVSLKRKLITFFSFLVLILGLVGIKDFGFLTVIAFAVFFQLLLAIYYYKDSKQKGIILVPVSIFLMIFLVIVVMRILLPSIILFISNYVWKSERLFERTQMLKFPFLFHSFKQLLLSFYLINEGFLFGKGFFTDLPAKATEYFYTDQPYSTFSFAGGVLLLITFYIFKFYLYTLIIVKIMEQTLPERRKRFSLIYLPVILCYSIFDMLPLLGAFRFLPFSGLPTIFLSYSIQLTIAFLFLVSPFFYLYNPQEYEK